MLMLIYSVLMLISMLIYVDADADCDYADTADDNDDKRNAGALLPKVRRGSPSRNPPGRHSFLGRLKII